MKKSDFLQLSPHRQRELLINGHRWYAQQQARYHAQIDNDYQRKQGDYEIEHIKFMVAAGLSRGEKVTQEDVARDLGISAPTLRRRLFAKRIRYQAIVDEQRFALLEPLVRDGMAIKHLVTVSGLNGLSGLSRWWRKQTGETLRDTRARGNRR